MARRVTSVAKLYDDESTRKKLEVMDRWEILTDDGRNEMEEFRERVEEFLEFGKTYRITIEEMRPC